MKKRFLLRCLLLVAAFSLVGCTEKTELVINKDDLVGKWQATDRPTEFWRYNADGTGKTWDEGDDVYEDDTVGVLHFVWTTVMSHLELDYAGEMGQHAFENYTVTHQTPDSLVWKDLYGDYRTFVKTI
jgi:outer membrane biogenesis lipoprotein LolB